MLRREYKMDNGIIGVDRNYADKQSAADVVKKCILFLAQGDNSLTRGSSGGIIRIGSDIPQGRRA